MKIINYISIFFLLLNLSAVNAQNASSFKIHGTYPVRTLTLEPAIGLNIWTMGDLRVSNVVQWNIKKRLSLISYSAYVYNNSMSRNFNYIRTDYDYTLNQKFGVGTSLYGRHSSHTFSLLAGIKYDAIKETLVNPEFEQVTASVHSVSPDFGLMYNLKKGIGKYFFTYRMVIPLYPYPFKSFDITSVDGNLANIAMEFGVGVRL
ncbi:MAG: hypothetical protein IPP15_23025 [Saprospiraceae bacterium]|uniref:Outer membrane protein beta-barrel domain-containing protein n=1 Tax=Candidatus Opimibacter skivensis TaxID=2982028 RepID=A0A9D7T045_9BACT|nr:hypothetical protein [Candidatus Opimibacter skivensis]